MPLIDYLLLTPLDEEWRTVRSVLCPAHANIKTRPIDTITYYLWKQPVNRFPDAVGDYLVVGAPMSRNVKGQAYAGVFTNLSVTQWKPSRVVLLGIAGSLEQERLKLGDVVVSSEIYGYEVGDAEAEINFRPTFNQTGALDYDRVRAFRDDPVDYPKWQQECLEAAGVTGLKEVDRPPELHLEVTASGNFVVKTVAHGEKLKREVNPKISAVEMEARGLYQALYLDVRRTDALMIRGISDYADENKANLEKTTKDAWRTYCAANAARLLRAIWQRGPVPPISSDYQLNLTLGPHTRFRERGVPNIEFKYPGAQDNAFPFLLNRSQPTPDLYLEVTAESEAGLAALDFRGLCIVESPQHQFIQGNKQQDGTMIFMLPASEWGIRVELLLSFPFAVNKIKMVCRDDFQRKYEGVIERPKH